MPSEPTNLRHLFAENPGTAIDVDSVVRRSRSRRAPRILAAGAFTVLAIGGIAAVSVQGLSQLGGGATSASNGASDSASESVAGEESSTLMESSADETIKRAPAERINLCTGTVAEVAPSQSGLELSVAFPATAPAGAPSIAGMVTLTNSGPSTLSGYTAASPAITLASDGIVVWHSNGPMIELARDVSLAPGESLEYAASFVPVVCGVEDDSAESFRSDLPAAPAGTYAVSAAIDFLSDVDADLVTGPAQTITLQ